jgi:AraC-like DNA-binding protein
VDINEDIKSFKSQDEKLIEKFRILIKENISNSEISIENISRQLGTSRISLYRKIKNSTGQTPSVFIRNVRIEQAAYLLTKKVPITEVVYAVGFNSHSYFTKMFCDYYGCTPTEYQKRNNAETEVNEP